MVSWLSNGVLLLAVLIVVAHVWSLRQAVRQREIIAVPMVTATWLSILAIVVLLLLGFSSLHLLWLLPLIVLLSLPLSASAFINHITFHFLALLAGPQPEPPPMPKKPSQKRKQRRAKKR